VLTRDDNALLFAPGDHGALAAALDRLVAEPALGPRLAESGRAWAAANADWARGVDRFEAMYAHAVRERLASRRATGAIAGRVDG
jgi:glycosyltransferase involved in cell wall biosynthesis